MGTIRETIPQPIGSRRLLVALVLGVSTLVGVGMIARGGPLPELEPRPSVGAYLDGRLPRTAPVPSGGWAAVPAFPYLTFADPTFLVPEPGSRRLFVGGRQGLIEAFEADPNVSTKATVLDLRKHCQGWDDSGLMGLAFHPEFAKPGSPNRGYVYVAYSWTEAATHGPGRPENGMPTTNRLARFTIPDGSKVADPRSELVLIDQNDQSVWHNGGGLFFHPRDGFLYLSLGDEGGDFGNTQRIDRDLFSGVIRIDVDRRGKPFSHPIGKRPETGTTDHYFIPDDNPWVGVPGALEEFWAIGLRSPHRMTVDPPTARVWLGDVGEGSREEIDIIEKAGNYQWNYREGKLNVQSEPSPLIGHNVPPVHDYSHDQGSAVIGGYVYRGPEHAGALGGKYVYGDNSGRIWALTYDEKSGKATNAHLCDLPYARSRSYGEGLSTFGVDHDGELYLARLGEKGSLFKLARTGATGSSWPRLLSQTRAFRDLRTLEPGPGLTSYAVNSPLWSDGASKRRWVAVPTGQKVGFAESGSWTFPAGSAFVKHFEVKTDETRTDSPIRRLETRFLVRDEAGAVFGATYKWRPDGSDADLLEAGLTEKYEVKTASGRQTRTWSYPSARECLMCHTPGAGYVLGLNSPQLNGSRPGGVENQVVAWNRSGMFDHPIDESRLEHLPRLVAINDPGASLEAKVRSYLAANCAHCHRPNGVRARFDARYETPLNAQGVVDVLALNPLGQASAKVVAPGDVARSVLHRRLASNEPATRMPPLARNVRDDPALAVVRAWIESLPPASKPLAVRLNRLASSDPVISKSEVVLEAEVSGEGVQVVEFLQGETVIGEARSAPYRARWKANAEGSYLISARVIDAKGSSATSDGVILTVVPPPPFEEDHATFLDGLEFKVATNGFGPVERRRSNGEDGVKDGRELRIKGKRYPRGLGVHAPSEIRVGLDGSSQAFLADVGIDDETSGGGSVTFQVWVDGSKLFDSGVMTAESRTRAIRIDLQGKHELTLIVTDAGDGISSDHADWTNARLAPASDAP